MNMVIPNDGKQLFLKRALGDGAQENLWVGLYKNDYTPVDASVTANFTAADFAGSTQIQLITATWGANAIVANVAVATYPTAPSWTHGGGASQTVYGWFLYGAVSGLIYAAQRFDAPRVLTTGASEALDPFAIKLKTFA